MSQSESVQPQKERLPHSTYGIRSLRLALPATVLYVVTLVIMVAMWHQIEKREYILWLLLLNVCFWGCTVQALAAFMYGIRGLLQPRTRRFYSMLGLIFSVIPFLHWVLVSCVFPHINYFGDK